MKRFSPAVIQSQAPQKNLIYSALEKVMGVLSDQVLALGWRVTAASEDIVAGRSTDGTLFRVMGVKEALNSTCSACDSVWYINRAGLALLQLRAWYLDHSLLSCMIPTIRKDADRSMRCQRVEADATVRTVPPQT